MQFKCSECGNVFDVSKLRLFFAQRPGMPARVFQGASRSPAGLGLPGSGEPTPISSEKNCYYLKCPKCKKTSWLIPLEE